MEQTVHLLPFVFFILSNIGIVLAAYAFQLDRRSELNRVFLAACLCMSVWSFGFSIADTASSVEACLFWLRFAALGWSMVYAVILHFTAVLTLPERLRGMHPLRRLFGAVLLYGPALLCAFAFSLGGGYARRQYRLVRDGAVWNNLNATGFWPWFFYAYFAFYSSAVLLLLLRWRQKARNPQQRRQASALFAAFGSMFLLGAATDIANAVFRWMRLPYLAPLYCAFLLAVLCYNIRPFHFLDNTRTRDDEIILNENRRLTIYGVSGLALICSGVLYFVIQYGARGAESLRSALSVSLTVVLLGVFLHLVLHFRPLHRYIEAVYIGVVEIAIPVIAIHFVQNAGTVFWSFPLILIVCALVFNQRLVMVATTASALTAQIFLWIVQPSAVLTVSGPIYTGRMGMLVFTSAAAYYVNTLYVRRLKENAEKTRMQSLITEISTDFVAANSSNIAEKLDRMLETIGRYFGLERCCLCLPYRDSAEWRRPFVWRNDDFPEDETCRGDFCRQWEQSVGSAGVVYFPDLQLLPQGDAIGRHFTRRRIRSLLSIPVIVNDKVAGYLNLASAESSKSWSEEHRSVMEVTARIAADALAKVEAEDQINRMAFYDGLTKLPNRLLFFDRARQSIETARRTGRKVGVVFVDLDSFKSVNDTLGHDSGDRLLRAAADRLVSCVRDSDTVSRFGGDEFLLLLTNLQKAADGGVVTAAVMNALTKPFVIDGQEIHITASAGIAVFPEDGDRAETLISNADNAMYLAKAKGKNGFLFCTEELKAELAYKAKLSGGLRRALRQGELTLEYQPQVRLADDSITGVEALLRWKHPELGTVMPAGIIPIAEQSGLIGDIGDWVLRTACRQLADWRRKGLPDLRLSVNVSVLQLHDPLFVQKLARLLAETGVPPSALDLELNENTAVCSDLFRLQRVLYELKRLGVGLSIDYFGSEHASIDRLKTLPVDRIKLDLSLVQSIDHGAHERAVTKVIISLVQELQLKLTAEGVESATQRNFLKQRMCDEAQGFFYYHPLPAEAAEALLFRKPSVPESKASPV